MRISEEYRKEQEALHATGKYGTASIGYAPFVSQVVNELNVEHLLDYGCGSLTNLLKHMDVKHKFRYQAYDPAVEEYSGDPVPAQMVACIDVLEHIEPEHLDEVLDHLEELTEVVGFFTVHTGPAIKTLSDGRNAHLIQQPLEWWLPKLWERFKIHSFHSTDTGFFVIVYSRFSHGRQE